MNHSRVKRILFFIFIILLILILRLPSLEEPFDNDSSAVAYSARLITRGEPLYGSHHPGHQMPGAYYTYALAFKLIGDRFQSIKIILIPWVIATAFLIYWLGLRVNNHRTGLFAALIFSILSSHVYLKGSTAEPEMFAMLPCTASVLLAVYQVQKTTSGWYIFAAGLFGGIAFLYKAVFLAPMVVAVGMILLDLWLTKSQANSVQLVIRRIAGLCIGFACVFLLGMGYFASQGLLGRFLLVFHSGTGYLGLTGEKPLYLIFIIGVALLAYNNLLVLFFGFIGTLRILRGIRFDSEKKRFFWIPAQGMVTWLILSILAAGITRYGYPHYGLIVVPPLSVIAGWELATLSGLLPKNANRKQKMFHKVGLNILLCLTFSISIYSNWKYYSSYIDYRLGIESYGAFLEEGTIEGKIYQRNKALGDYVSAHTTPQDKIYYWSDFPQIYYLTDRLAPIDMIWPTQAELTGSYKRIFTPQTKYIIVGTSLYLPVPDWMQDELQRSYNLEAVIDEQRIYRRRGE